MYSSKFDAWSITDHITLSLTHCGLVMPYDKIDWDKVLVSSVINPIYVAL